MDVVSKSVTASTQRISFPYQLVFHFFSTSDKYLIVCCHTHLNIQTQTQACTTCVMGRTCHQKLLSATFCYITLQMSLSAGGWMKDLRVCVCVCFCAEGHAFVIVWPCDFSWNWKMYGLSCLFSCELACFAMLMSHQRILTMRERLLPCPLALSRWMVFGVCIESARNTTL